MPVKSSLKIFRGLVQATQEGLDKYELSAINSKALLEAFGTYL